jgi:hypothetical protein
LVAFSCKRRGFCPSCGARRMIETSAHLVDHVIPDVSVRQWVLSFPWPLRCGHSHSAFWQRSEPKRPPAHDRFGRRLHP